MHTCVYIDAHYVIAKKCSSIIANINFDLFLVLLFKILCLTLPFGVINICICFFIGLTITPTLAYYNLEFLRYCTIPCHNL